MKCEVNKTTQAAATQPPQASTGGQHMSPFTHSPAVAAFLRLVLWISFILRFVFIMIMCLGVWGQHVPMSTGSHGV